VPTHYTENPKLGRWVHTQRHQRRLQTKGKKSCMNPERIDLLDQLGFSWEVRPSLERPRATWQQRLEELEAFHKKTSGNFQVLDPSTMPQLHAWCHEQRNRLTTLDNNNTNNNNNTTTNNNSTTNNNTNKDGTNKELSTSNNNKRMTAERVEALKTIGFTKDTELLEQLKQEPFSSETMTVTTTIIKEEEDTKMQESSERPPLANKKADDKSAKDDKEEPPPPSRSTSTKPKEEEKGTKETQELKKEEPTVAVGGGAADNSEVGTTRNEKNGKFGDIVTVSI
jgi:hypothetical protein